MLNRATRHEPGLVMNLVASRFLRLNQAKLLTLQRPNRTTHESCNASLNLPKLSRNLTPNPVLSSRGRTERSTKAVRHVYQVYQVHHVIIPFRHCERMRGNLTSHQPG